MLNLFHLASEDCSRMVTERYSTSFSSAIRMLHKDLRAPVCNIYGFVRLADEIVDSFHDYNKQQLLADFKQQTYAAIRDGISLNPVLHSFQRTVNSCKIEHHLIDAFFASMEMDLTQTTYQDNGFREYIYGSAEVVGLMCLHVFCEGNIEKYKQLQPAARALGAAFQKVNFLRDIKADYAGLSRLYFPNCNMQQFSCEDKRKIEEGIQFDFDNAKLGIVQLPLKARFGVYVAYKYYLSLFKKIKKLKADHILENRVRIPNYHKAMIVLKARMEDKWMRMQPQTA